MSRFVAIALAGSLAAAGSGALARGGSHGGHHSAAEHHRSTRADGVQRDALGRIERSVKAKDEFKRQHPCPSTGSSRGACPGYLIDHVQPLKRGGADAPHNMQWQTHGDAKAKDRWE